MAAEARRRSLCDRRGREGQDRLGPVRHRRGSDRDPADRTGFRRPPRRPAADGVGYISAGTDELAFDQAVAALRDRLGIDHLLLEGGGHINGAFLRADLIDAISLMIVPAIDGITGAPAVFDGPDDQSATALPFTRLALEEQETLGQGIVWLHYRVIRDAA